MKEKHRDSRPIIEFKNGSFIALEDCIVTFGDEASLNKGDKIDMDSQKIEKNINHSLKQINDQDERANKILRHLTPGQEISVKDIKKVYGKNWKKSLACSPLPDQVPQRDKKKAKAAKKARKNNRRRK